MAKGKRRVHDFCWISVMTPEFDAAEGFFKLVFGWT
jgi:uncharacterized protein